MNVLARPCANISKLAKRDLLARGEEGGEGGREGERGGKRGSGRKGEGGRGRKRGGWVGRGKMDTRVFDLFLLHKIQINTQAAVNIQYITATERNNGN